VPLSGAVMSDEDTAIHIKSGSNHSNHIIFYYYWSIN
jgi:hypothetical protein